MPPPPRARELIGTPYGPRPPKQTTQLRHQLVYRRGPEIYGCHCENPFLGGGGGGGLPAAHPTSLHLSFSCSHSGPPPPPPVPPSLRLGADINHKPSLYC